MGQSESSFDGAGSVSQQGSSAEARLTSNSLLSQQLRNSGIVFGFSEEEEEEKGDEDGERVERRRGNRLENNKL